jgi:hypothetical protein
MKKIIITIFCSLFFVFSFAQPYSSYDKTWATYFGGMGTRIIQIEADNEGNIIVCGGLSADNNAYCTTDSITEVAYYGQFASGYEYGLMNFDQSVIAKFSPQGDLLLSVYLPVYITCMKVTDSGEVYIGGLTVKASLGTANAWQQFPQIIVSNAQYGFISKLNTDFDIDWLTYTPTTPSSNVIFFDIDENNNIYAAGTTNITSNITTPNVFQANFMTEGRLENGYLFKLNSSGNLEWATYYGHTSFYSVFYYGGKVTVAANRQSSLSLSQYDEYYRTKGAYQSIASGQIISQFDAGTGKRLYSTYLGNGELHIENIAGNESNIYLSGFTSGNISDVNLITDDARQPQYGGGMDNFIICFTNNFTPVWGTYIGGTMWEGLMLESANSNFRIYNNYVYFFGNTSSGEDFINCDSAYQNNNHDNEIETNFIMKFALDGRFDYGSLLFLLEYDSDYYYGGDWAGGILPLNDSIFYVAGFTGVKTGVSTPNSHQEYFSEHPVCYQWWSNNTYNGFIAKFTLKHSGIDTTPNGVYTPQEESIAIFPNPAKNEIFIKNAKNENIRIFNILGKEIPLIKDGDKIDVSALQSGIYVVKIGNGEICKFIKE